MRRLWLIGMALLLTLQLPCRASDEPPMDVHQVAPHTYYVQGLAAAGSGANQNFISNAGFVVGPQGVVVIDALGAPVLAERLLEVIRRVTPQPVTHVIVTHYHADHIYGLQVFRARGAQVIAQRRALDYIQSETAAKRLEDSRITLAPWVDEDTRVVAADRWIDGPTTLNLAGLDFHLDPAGPSHTPEDITVHVPAEGVLFCGDLIFSGRLPFVGQVAGSHWVSALDQLLAYRPKVVVPGHGPASTTPQQDIRFVRDYLVYLRAAMTKAAEELTPFEEAYAQTDWSRFEHVPMFRYANRMNAYNTYLMLEQAGAAAASAPR